MRWKRHLFFVLVSIVCFTSVQAQVTATSKTPPMLQERVFFSFDDHSIPWQHNLKLTLVAAKKHPSNPVLRRGAEGAPDHRGASLYGTVIRNGDKFRMWYLGRAETTYTNGLPPLNWTPLCYAESTDGVNWTKPELGLVEFNGNRKNNICLIEGNPASMTVVNDFVSVLYDPADPDPSRLYKAIYISYPPSADVPGGLSAIGHKEDSTIAAVCVTSADGLRWKISGKPANAGGERFEATSLYKFDNFYYATGQLLPPWAWLPDGRDGGQIMQVYRSPDFKNWSKAKAFSFARPGQLLNPSIADQDTHMGAGLWNRGNVMVGLYGIWQDAATNEEDDNVKVDLGLLISNDGIHYREPIPDFKVIARGGKSEWDNIALLHAHAYVNIGDTTMIWYSNMDVMSRMIDQKEIGLATIRRDGFGYLSRKEDDNDAMFMTTSFMAGNKEKLFLNASGIDNHSALTVELYDHLDRPIAGYSGKNSGRLATDGTSVEIRWPLSRSTFLPSGKRIAVRINFPVNSAAKVYAVSIRK